MKARITANTITLSRDEVLSMVEPGLLKYLKADNPKPLLKAYVVAHEGEASPNFEAGYTGAKVIKFTKESVSKVFSKINEGVKLFFDHYKEDPTEPRETIAEVVGKSIREVNGKLSSVIVAFFKTQKEDMAKYESVSMEADLEIGTDGTVQDVLDFTAVAIVPDGKKPALSGANALATIRANNKDSKGKFMSETASLDWHILEAEFRKKNGLPSQVTDPEDMIGMIEVTQDGKFITTGKDKKYGQYVAQLFEKTLAKKTSPLEPKLIEVQNERDQLARKLAIYEAKPKIIQKAKEAKLGDDFVHFIEKRIERFKASDDIDASINEWIEEKKLDYQDLYKPEDVKGTPSSANKPTVDPLEVDYSDPANNPLL